MEPIKLTFVEHREYPISIGTHHGKYIKLFVNSELDSAACRELAKLLIDCAEILEKK